MFELKKENIAVFKIVENFRTGLWTIPEFLSDSEWEVQNKKTLKFFQYLYRGYPIPGILIWESALNARTPTQHDIPRSTALVFDGQRQIIALCKAMDKESDIKIVFNPRGNARTKDGLFRFESAITRKSKEWICLNQILGNRDDFCAVLDDEKSKEHRERLVCLREIVNNELPVAKMLGSNYEEVNKAVECWKMLKPLGKWMSKF
jgi:hypothetical protein